LGKFHAANLRRSIEYWQRSFKNEVSFVAILNLELKRQSLFLFHCLAIKIDAFLLKFLKLLIKHLQEEHKKSL
jgi:hypothetical protein